MKRLIIPMFFLTLISSAQDFGIKAGLNITDMMISESNFFTYKDSYKMHTGFHIGAITEIRVYDFLFLESGISFNSKGYTGISKEIINNETFKIYEKKNLFYLDAPIMFKVPFSIGNARFFGSAGGYAGMGLFGDTKITSWYGNLLNKVKWGSEEGADDLKRFDYGLTFGTGIIIHPFQIGASYSIGLGNISTASTSGAELRNRVIGISLSCLFGSQRPQETDIKPVEEKPETSPLKKEKVQKAKPARRNKAEMESERLRLEKIRTDSISSVMAEQERIRMEKIRSDSITTAMAEQERLRLEKIRTDSISAAMAKESKDVVIYRVQFASSMVKKGSYNIDVAGKSFTTWEYFYSGAYRSTVGEFKSLAEARALQNVMRKSGYTQAFVVAFRNKERSNDPALFR